MLEVRKIEPEMTYNLRHTILRPNQPIEDSMYDTDHDENGFHVGAFYEGKLVSVASFIADNHPDFAIENQYRLRQMATHEEYRKLGAGRAIVKYAENLLKEQGVFFVWCKGKTNVQDYYSRLGFNSHGDAYDYPPIGLHIVMFKKLL